MITVNGQEYSFGDPLVLIALAGFLVALLLVFVLFALRANSKAARLSEPLVYQMGDIGQRVGDLAAGQERLAGGLKHVSEAQAASQAETLKLMEYS